MTNDELRALSMMCREPLYLFWFYPSEENPLSTQQLMRWRSMPCTPAGDLVADITGMSFAEAAQVITANSEDAAGASLAEASPFGLRVRRDVIEDLQRREVGR